MLVFFGTYTKRLSNGIYSAEFDTLTGQLTNRQLVVAEPNPTYLAFTNQLGVYSVGTQDGKGGIAAFAPGFHYLNHVVEEGAPLCYVSVDNKRKLVYGANYHKGEVLVYKQAADGSLTLADKDIHYGSGPHENQASAHVHYADLTPDQLLITCDLGCDQLHTYEISTQGKLSLLTTTDLTPGAGPRHLVFHPILKYVYVICELNSTIESFIYDGYGDFERQQIISTLPEDYSGFNGAGAIRLSTDGRFLYASNRGHDSIAVYRLLLDGTLELVEIVPTQGKMPRDFAVTPDNNYLIVAHQDSDNVTVFRRDLGTGMLSEISHDFEVPEAVCVAIPTLF